MRFRFLLAFLLFAPMAWGQSMPASAPASAPVSGSEEETGLGNVIYIRHQGDRAFYIHAEHGDLLLHFPSPSILGLSDLRHTLRPDDDSYLFRAEVERPPVTFHNLDPRFQSIETDALRVEIERQPFRITVKDNQGQPIIADDATGGLRVQEGIAKDENRIQEWSFQFPPKGGVRGFGRLDEILPGVSGYVDTQPTFDVTARYPGIVLPSSQCGRLGERCGAVFALDGSGRFEYTSLGHARVVRVPFEAYVFPAPDAGTYVENLRTLFGRPNPPPKWLFGTGCFLERPGGVLEMFDLPARLAEQGFPIDWLAFANGGSGAIGWREPYASSERPQPLTSDSMLNPRFKEIAKERLESLDENGIGYLFEYWSLGHLENSWGGSYEMRELYAVNGIAYPPGTSLPPSLGLTRHGRPLFLSSQSDLRSEPNSVFLAPWAIDPKAAKPTEAFRAAGIAGEQGYTLWGLVLPVGAEAYPSMAAYRRWMQAAVAAPVLLLRAETREETDLSNLPAEALRELQRTRAVRSRLRPVFYNLMREATLKGTPLCAPAQTKEAGAAIRLGPDLVFTVADPEEARGIVHVEMPEGKWVSLRDNRDVSSSHTLDLALAENQMDAFVRAGSILPFWGDLEGAEGPRLVERLYPSESGAFRLYEDAGDGLGYQKGEFAVTTTEWKYDAAKKALAVTIAGPVGDYAEKAMARSLLLQVAMPKQPTAVFLDGKAVERKPYVAGPSQLLEPDPALRLETAEQPAYPLWDHDGAAFLYLWLPQRAAITKVEIYGPPSF